MTPGQPGKLHCCHLISLSTLVAVLTTSIIIVSWRDQAVPLTWKDGLANLTMTSLGHATIYPKTLIASNFFEQSVLCSGLRRKMDNSKSRNITILSNPIYPGKCTILSESWCCTWTFGNFIVYLFTRPKCDIFSFFNTPITRVPLYLLMIWRIRLFLLSVLCAHTLQPMNW